MFAIENRTPKLLPVVISLGLHGAVAALVLAHATHLPPSLAPAGITVTIDALPTAIAPGAEVPPTAAPASMASPDSVPEAVPNLSEQAAKTAALAEPMPAEIATARPEPAAPAAVPPQAAFDPGVDDSSLTTALAVTPADVASAPVALNAAKPAAMIPAERLAATALPAEAAPVVREDKAAVSPAPVDDAAPNATASPEPREQPAAPQALPSGEQQQLAPATASVAAAASTPPVLETAPASAELAEVDDVPSSIDRPLARTTWPARTLRDAFPAAKAPSARMPAIETLSPPSAPAQAGSDSVSAAAQPSALPTMPSATVVPDAPSTTLDDTPDAQPPIAPTAQVAKLETDPSTAAVEAFVANHDGGPCFYASVTRTSANGVAIDVLAADKSTFQPFNDAFVATFGLDPDVLGQRVTPAQCPAVEMLRRSRPDNSLKLKVDRDRIAGNAPIVGSVDNRFNMPISLYLVDESGRTSDITRYSWKSEGQTRFSVPMISSGRRGLVPTLLIAVGGEMAPKLVQIPDGNLDPSRFAMAGKLVIAGSR